MWKNKRIKRILARYGRVPEEHYEYGDLRGIRAYHDDRRAKNPWVWALDDIIWSDLSMDAVFERLCNACSTSGEQGLYDQLRCPALDEAEYNRRLSLIRLMEQEADLRLKLQVLLSKLGKSRAAQTSEAYAPSAYGRGDLSSHCCFSRDCLSVGAPCS